MWQLGADIATWILLREEVPLPLRAARGGYRGRGRALCAGLGETPRGDVGCATSIASVIEEALEP